MLQWRTAGPYGTPHASAAPAVRTAVRGVSSLNMNFLGVGAAEAGLVFVIALIVVGPQRFPEMMRSAGRWYRIARAYSNEVMKDVRSAVSEIEREVKAETEDLNVAQDLKDLQGDLRQARESADDVKRDTQNAAAGTGSPPASKAPPASTATSKASTPSINDPDPFKAKAARDAAAARERDQSA